MIVNLLGPLTRNAGVYDFGPQALPAGLTRLTLTLPRYDWPDTGDEIVSAHFDLSFDRGVSWPVGRSLSARGGVHIGRSGIELHPKITLTWDTPTVHTARLRGSATLLQRLMLGVDLEIAYAAGD